MDACERGKREGDVHRSPGWCGYVEAELPGQLGAIVEHLVVAADRARVLDELEAEVIGDSVRYESEYRIRHKDGSLHWTLACGAVVRDAAGVPLRVTGTSIDVTRLKRVDEAGVARDRLERAVLGSKACTWDFEMPDGEIRAAKAHYTNLWELMGYDYVPSQINAIGDAFEYMLRPEDRASFLGEVEIFLAGSGRDWEREMRALHKDGTERWHLTRGTAVRDPAGRATRFTGTSIDITDRKLAEHALQVSEERLRRTFENAAVSMILTDLDGYILEYNARFCEFLGYSRDELVGHSFREVMFQEAVEADVERFRAVVRGASPWFTRDERYIRKDGAIVWGNITMSVIERHADGTAAIVMAILQDITQRKELEAAIEKADERVQLAMRGSDVAMFAGEFLDGNVAASTWTYFNFWEPMGFEPGDAPTEFARHSAIAVHQDDLPAVLAQFEAAVASRSPNWYVEHRFQHCDGSIRWRLSRGTLVFDDRGALASFIGTATDITDLKKVQGELHRTREAAEAANRAKDDSSRT